MSTFAPHAQRQQSLSDAAAIWGAMRATVDTFTAKTTPEQRRFLGRLGISPAALDTVRYAMFAAGDGDVLDPTYLTGTAADRFLSLGPQHVQQLPPMLPRRILASLGPDSDIPQLLLQQWRSEVHDVVTQARSAWLTAIERRLELEHPLVRVAAAVTHDDYELSGESLNSQEVTEVADPSGHSPIRMVSALMHPNEAEALLRPCHHDAALHTVSGFFLLPSAGVSAARLKLAAELQRHVLLDVQGDPPMRSLVHALTAAANILGEPAVGAPGGPEAAVTSAYLAALLPQAIEDDLSQPF